jgi:hypothetical protein
MDSTENYTAFKLYEELEGEKRRRGEKEKRREEWEKQ